LKPWQEEALKEYWPDGGSGVSAINGNYSYDEDMVQAYFDFFDKFYFFGSLKADARVHCYISILPEEGVLGACHETEHIDNQTYETNTNCRLRLVEYKSGTREEKLIRKYNRRVTVSLPNVRKYSRPQDMTVPR